MVHPTVAAVRPVIIACPDCGTLQALPRLRADLSDPVAAADGHGDDTAPAHADTISPGAEEGSGELAAAMADADVEDGRARD